MEYRLLGTYVMAMKFTKTQMLAHVDSDDDFALWYVDEFMKKNLPDPYYTVSAEGKLEMVKNGRKYARIFDFHDSETQAHFITLMWKIGANFFMHSGFREIASSQSLNPAQKIDKLYAVSEEQAVHAIMNPDDRYWYPEMLPMEKRIVI